MEWNLRHETIKIPSVKPLDLKKNESPTLFARQDKNEATKNPSFSKPSPWRPWSSTHSAKSPKLWVMEDFGSFE